MKTKDFQKGFGKLSEGSGNALAWAAQGLLGSLSLEMFLIHGEVALRDMGSECTW